MANANEKTIAIDDRKAMGEGVVWGKGRDSSCKEPSGTGGYLCTRGRRHAGVHMWNGGWGSTALPQKYWVRD